MKTKLKVRFETYWKMEILCVLLFPVVFILWMVSTGQVLGWFSFACFTPTAALLVIGSLYWKGKLESLDRSETTLDRILNTAQIFKYPLLIFTLASVALSLSDLLWIRQSRSTGDRIGGLVAAMLAVLEYVNYYYVQLQHFDHRTDFRRLITGGGFRKSHLSRELCERRVRKIQSSG